MSAVTPGTASSLAWVGGSTLDDDEISYIKNLVRMAQDDAEIKAVWLQVHHEATTAFIPLVAAHLSISPESLEAWVTSAILNAALTTAVERFALDTPEVRTLNELISDVVRIATD